MVGHLLGRLLSLGLTLTLASVVVFGVVEVLPGDPAQVMLGVGAAPDTVAALREALGLGGSIPARYLAWAGGMLTGDFGLSYTYRVPVAGLVADRLALSLPLAGLALLLAMALGLPAGAYAALRRGRAGDAAVSVAAQVGLAVPNFWAALLLVLGFAVGLRWFPSGGFPGWGAPLAASRALVLPAVALALPQAAILARVLRAALIETEDKDYIRAARARGLTRRQALLRHGLGNAMLPVLTILGLQVSFLLAGAVIVEAVFALPGLGRLVFQAIAQRDLVVVEAVVMLLVLAVVLANFAVDVAYALADPRLRRRA